MTTKFDVNRNCNHRFDERFPTNTWLRCLDCKSWIINPMKWWMREKKTA